METQEQPPFLQTHPYRTMIVVAFILGLIGVVLTLTVAGALIGLPLMVVAALLGIFGWRQHAKGKG
ncbi:MAG TPA: hypothetical protein VEQ63_14330 [Bryobacteraceae bacterium]|nr:hypothetical protein [Bryobacteraceae bacterium]